MVWSDPKNGADVCPAAHVRAVHQDDVFFLGIEEIPGFVMGRSHIEIENVNWFSCWNVSWQLPGLLEVFGTFHEVKIITVGVGDTWGFDWSIWAPVILGAPLAIVNNLLFVDVLAIVTIPEFVVAILLPPFSVQIGKFSVYSWLRFWTFPWNIGELNTSVFHIASEEISSGLGIVGKSTLGGTVLVVELHWSVISVVQ